MARLEVVRFVESNFRQQEITNGFTNPYAVTMALCKRRSFPAFESIERSILRMSTGGFLYEGAQDTIRSLLLSGDQVMIWTQGHEKGQIWKVAKSGLGSMRRELPSEERKRFSVIVSRDKIEDLPDLLGKLEDDGVQNVVIVDDKSKNISDVDKKTQEWQERYEGNGLRVHPVWINQGRTKDNVPEGYTLDSFRQKFRTIQDIRELGQLKDLFTGEKTAWLLDFDHTLLHTAAAQGALFERLADLMEGSHPNPLISYGIDFQLGLINGNVRSVEELKSGMSGGKVMRITTDDDGVIVVKYNPKYPQKVHREIDGYQQLIGTPLGKHMVIPIYSSRGGGVIALPSVDGIQLRNGLKEEILSLETARKTLENLLSIKKSWWQGQQRMVPSVDFTSMQRSEWPDTAERVDKVAMVLSEKFGIPLESVWSMPLKFNNVQYPSLSQLVGSVSDLLKKKPPYVILSHGDATGANILVDPVKGKWKLIDAEWTGYTDPAESFVRMIKYVSTTTHKSVGEANAFVKDDVIQVDLQIEFPESAIALQRYGLQIADVFAVALSDSTFTQRVRDYLAGSYLREFALAEKRGHPELGLFAMIKAAEAIL